VKVANDSLCKVETKEGCCVSVQTVLRQSYLKFRPEKPGRISKVECSLARS